MKRHIHNWFVILILAMAIAVPAVHAAIEQDFQIGVSLNYDSDINVDPEYIEFSADEKDMGFTLSAEYSITPFISGNHEVGFEIDAAMDAYQEEDQYNNDSIGLKTFYRVDEVLDKFTFYVNYTYHNYNVDGDAYLYTNTLHPQFFWPHSDTLTSVFAFRIRKQNYYNIDALEGMDMGFSFKEIIQINDSQELVAGIFINDAKLDAEEMSYLGMELNADYTWRFMKAMALNAAVAIGNKKFEEDYPGEGDPRNENYIHGTVCVEYDLGKAGTVFVGAVFSDNSSNVDQFDIDRNTISAGYVFNMEF